MKLLYFHTTAQDEEYLPRTPNSRNICLASDLSTRYRIITSRRHISPCERNPGIFAGYTNPLIPFRWTTRHQKGSTPPRRRKPTPTIDLPSWLTQNSPSCSRAIRSHQMISAEFTFVSLRVLLSRSKMQPRRPMRDAKNWYSSTWT